MEIKRLTTEEIGALRRHVQNGEECIDGKACAHDEVLSVLDEVDCARALLKRIEWKDRGTCIECGNDQHEGHRDWCWVGALAAAA